ncbi:uncharacterized protein [Heliangelus exortis]|uniref:uncharacterized protein n=1 Tax=Heliangelus exortis TaxID=472823 RepID=UPI003A8DAAD1
MWASRPGLLPCDVHVSEPTRTATHGTPGASRRCPCRFPHHSLISRLLRLAATGATRALPREGAFRHRYRIGPSSPATARPSRAGPCRVGWTAQRHGSGGWKRGALSRALRARICADARPQESGCARRAAPGEGWAFPRRSALIYVRTAARRGRPRTAGRLWVPGQRPTVGPADGDALPRQARPARTRLARLAHLPAHRHGRAWRSARSRALLSPHRAACHPGRWEAGGLREEQARSGPSSNSQPGCARLDSAPNPPRLSEKAESFCWSGRQV